MTIKYNHYKMVNYGAGSPLGIFGIALIIIGIIMCIIFVAVLIYYENLDQPLWVWLVGLFGLGFAIIGGVMLAWALSVDPTKTTVVYLSDNQEILLS